MKDITAANSTKTGAKGNYSQGREKKLSFAQKQQTQCLCGAGSSMDQVSAALTAPYSETKAPTNPATLYAKRMKLLIESGLVAGITPTSVRQQSSQQTLVFALSKQGGSDSSGEREAG